MPIEFKEQVRFTGGQEVVLVSTTAPSSPETGDLWLDSDETPSNALAQSGSSVRGNIGYAQVTAGQTGITTEVDLTGLSVAVTVNSGERIKITGQVLANVGTSGSNQAGALKIKEGGTLLMETRSFVTTAGVAGGFRVEAILTPTAGAHTYKLTFVAENGGGTWALVAAATIPAFILVEGIGT